jgi:hypothetical protein
MRFAGKSGTLREMGRRSVLNQAVYLPEIVVANPYRVERVNGETLDIIQDVTKTTAQIIGAITTYMASSLGEFKPVGYRIKRHKIMQRSQNELGAIEECVAPIDDQEAREILMKCVMERPGNAHKELRRIKKERSMTQKEYLEVLNSVDIETMDTQLFDVALGQKMFELGLLYFSEV